MPADDSLPHRNSSYSTPKAKKASQSDVLVVDSLTKRYDAKHGIFDINLAIKQGEIFGFLGPNGAGKSTTINTILDILRPTAGTITILGQDHHKQAKNIHKRLGYLSGDMETDPTLTGQQYLRFVAHLRGGVSRQRIDQLASQLKADTTTKIKHLSRGSKQKIGLIAALMHDPDLLILDEPTSGLDPLIQSEFNAIIHEHKARGKTTFISSHVLSEVQNLCDRVGFIREGKLIHVSTLETLLQNAPRRVMARFTTDTPPLQEIQKLAGVRDMRHEDGAVTFLFQGDINALLRLLSTHPLHNVQITETDLEELFMSYYKGKQPSEKEPRNDV